jgi:hypothetical protein
MSIIEKFKDITNYDIKKFFSDFVYFIENNYKDIVGYYNGQDIDREAFNSLDDLKRVANEVNSVIEFNSDRFDNSEFWELIDKFSNIQIQLSTIDNLSRWLRSSRTDRYDATIKVEYIQKQLESLEQISKKSGDINPDDSWINLAIKNDLNEEKYTSAGGVIMSINFANNLSFNIKNVVDTLKFENLYGKDIQKRFEIINGDIATLQGISSLEQTFETIFLTMKGSIPEFPEDGINSELIGSNANTISYPSIFRNLVNMFQKDDRFSSVDLIDLYRQDDAIYLKIQAKTKIGDILLNEIPL